MAINKNFWKNKNILITGNTGFKGSWLTLFLNILGANVFGLSIDERDGIYNISKVSKYVKAQYQADVSNLDINEMRGIFESLGIEIIFHFAAQSLVYEGYKSPRQTIETNINGMFNILEVFNNIDGCKSIIISTTDKVYKNPQSINSEDYPLGGKDFYSASKASSEFIIEAYKNSFLNDNKHISVVRSGNVIGGGDRAEDRLFTDIVNKSLQKQEIQIRNPKSIRPWQYVLDSLHGYLLVAQENYVLSKSNIYNLNSETNNKFDVQYIVEKFVELWGEDLKINYDNKSHYKEVDILKINSDKAINELGWRPMFEIDHIIEKIVNWEKSYSKDKNSKISISEIEEFIKLLEVNNN